MVAYSGWNSGINIKSCLHFLWHPHQKVSIGLCGHPIYQIYASDSLDNYICENAREKTISGVFRRCYPWRKSGKVYGPYWSWNTCWHEHDVLIFGCSLHPIG